MTLSNLNEIIDPILEPYVNPDERLSFRKWITSQFNIELRRAPRITVLGNTGVGKTSTINALFGTNLPVGHVEPTTKQPEEIHVHGEVVQGLKGSIMVYDMPGVNDSEEVDEQYIESYKLAIKKSDVAVWIIQASTRGLRYDQMILNEKIFL